MAIANRSLRSSMLLSTAMAALATVPGAANAQLVTSGDLIDATDSGGNPGQLTVVDTSAIRTDMTVLAPVVVANWSRFNVPTGTTVGVANGTTGSTATLVNRVIAGGPMSDIRGTIDARNVNLWLINQNGIMFGNGASITSASFYASTLDVTDQDLFDFYSGTDVAGNGSQVLNFSDPNGVAVDAITTAPGATVNFVTDGSLMFVSERLDLDANFDAGTGRVSFVTAADVDVTFTPGSPLQYVVNAGTTVAEGQTIGGTVTGGGVDFAMFTASSVVDAVLQVDALVTATTAVPTDNGVRLQAEQIGAGTVTVELNGGINTTGRVLFNADGTINAAAGITGSGIEATSDTGLALDDLTATDGEVRLLSAGGIATGDIGATGAIDARSTGTGAIALGTLTATDTVTLNTLGGVTTGAIAAGGALTVGNIARPNGVTFSGNVSARSITVDVGGAFEALDLTSTAGGIDIDADLFEAGAISVTGGNALLIGDNGVTTGNITSSGSIDVDSVAGTILVGALDAGLGIKLDTSGTITTGAITAGGALEIGTDTRASAVTINGNALASEVDIRTALSLTAQDIRATTGGISLNGQGSATTGNVRAQGNISLSGGNTSTSQFASLTSDAGAITMPGLAPGVLRVTGNTIARSVFLIAAQELRLGNVTATAGGIGLISAFGSIVTGNLSATSGGISVDSAFLGTDDPATEFVTTGTITATGGSVTLTAPGAIQTGGITATLVNTAGGAISASGGPLTIGSANAATGVTLTSSGSITIGDIVGIAIEVFADGSLTAGNVTATNGEIVLRAQGGNLVAGAVEASGDIEFSASNTGSATFASLISQNGEIASLGLTPGSITVTGLTRGTTVFLTAVNNINLGNVVATAGGVVLSGSNGSVTAGNITAADTIDLFAGTTLSTGTIFTSVGDITLNGASGITTGAVTTEDGALTAASTGNGAIALGALSATGAIALDTTGSIATGAIAAGGALTIGGVARPNGVTFGGNVSAQSIAIDMDGTLDALDLTATGGGIAINADLIDTAAISATGGDVNLFGSNGVTTAGISTTGAIDVESASGPILLGALNAGLGIALDTTGTVTTGAITAGGALTIGSAVLPSTVTINGNALAGSVDIRSVSGIVARDIEATSGNVFLSGSDVGFVGSITAGNVRASGNLLFEAGNNSRAEFASLTSTGGRVAVSGTLPGVLVVTGEVRGTVVALFSLNEMRLANVTSTSGELSLTGFRGNVVAGNLSATGGNVLVRTATLGSIDRANEFVTLGNVSAAGGNVTINAPGNITTSALTATAVGGVGGAISATSSAGGNVSLGNLTADGAITLNTIGNLSLTGPVSSGEALTIGNLFRPSLITMSSGVTAASVTINASATGALNAGNITARTGDIVIDAGTISALNLEATAGGVRLLAVTDISTRRITAGTTVDIDSTGADGVVSLGRVVGGGLITIDSNGTIGTGGITSTGGLIEVGLASSADSVSFGGPVDGLGINVRTTGAFAGTALTATAGSVVIGAGSIDVTSAITAIGGDVDLTAVGDVRTRAITADDGFIDVDSTGVGGDVALGKLSAGLDITLDADGDISATAVTSTGGALLVGRGTQSADSVTLTGNAGALSIDILTTGAFNGLAMTAGVGSILVDAGSINATVLTALAGNVDLTAVGDVITTGITADNGFIDVDSTGVGGDLTLGKLSAGGDITLDADGDISATAVTSTGGALLVGRGTQSADSVTFTGNAGAQRIDILTTGAFIGRALTATAGSVLVDAASINAGTVAATGGDVDLTAVGDVITGAITATGFIDVDSTGTGGDLNLGRLIAGGDITLDADGDIATTSSLQAGGVLLVGRGAQSANSVTFGGNASAVRIDVLTTGAFGAIGLAATGGSVVVDAGSISAGIVSATTDVDLTALGDVRTVAITATGLIDVDSTGVGGNLDLGDLDAGQGITLDADGTIRAAEVTAGTTLVVGRGMQSADGVTFTGNATARSIDVLTAGAFTGLGLTATAGSVLADAGSIDLGAVSATGGNVDLTAAGNVRTGALTATGLIDVDSTGVGGNLDLDRLIAGQGITLDADGSITTRSTIQAGTTLVVGRGTQSADSVTFTGNAAARSIDVLTAGAFTGLGLTATAGSVLAGAGSIDVGAVSATGGNVDLTAVGNVRSGALTATGFIDVDSTGVGGDLTLGDIDAGLGITLDADGDIRTGSVTSTDGALDVGLAPGASPDSVTFGGNVSAVFVDVRSTGEILAGERSSTGALLRRTTITATGATSDLRLNGGSITTGQLTAQGNNVDLTATGNIDVTGITAAASIEVDSTGTNGNLRLGTLTAGQGISLNADGTIRTLAVTAGGALSVGLASTPNGVTFGGNVSARSMQVLSAGEVLAAVIDENGAPGPRTTITTTGGDAIILADRITTAAITATGGNVILRTTGNIDTGALTATRVGMQGGRVEARSSGGDLLLGAIDAAREVDLDAAGSATVAAILARAGAVTVDANRITITGATSATEGDVLLTAARAITTGAITSVQFNGSGGGIVVTSTGTGDNAGAISLGVLDASRGVQITGGGAIGTLAITARRGSVSANGRSITVDGAIIATEGDVRLTALRNITTGAITANRASNLGGVIDIESTGTGENAGMLNLGALIADVGIELDARGAIATRALTARGGAIDIDGGSILIDGAASATGGNVRLLAVGNITTDSITARVGNNAGGAIDIVSTNGAINVRGTADAAGALRLTALGDASIASGVGQEITVAANEFRVSGTLTSRGSITIDAGDVEFGGAVTTATNGTLTLNARREVAIGPNEAANQTAVFSLSNAEIARISAGTLAVNSGNRAITFTGAEFGSQAGRTTALFNAGSAGITINGARFAAPASDATASQVVFASTGTIAITGDLTGSGANRTFRLGGAADGTNVATRITSNINTATINLGTATLDLRGTNIVFGTQSFINEVAPFGLPDLVSRFIANAQSTLYNPTDLSAARLANPVYLTAGSMNVTYGGSALFQNAVPRSVGGAFNGARLGTGGDNALRINPSVAPQSSPPSFGNVFAIFGTINNAEGAAAALVGPSVIRVNGQVFEPATRINGCIIGSAAGCVTTIVGNFVLNLPREVISPIVAEPGGTVPFDPLVGGNNESLFSDAASPPKSDEECRQRDANGVCVVN